MTSLSVQLEIGKKKVVASTVAWPGLCRVGKGEAAALEALISAVPRYSRVMGTLAADLQFPISATDICIAEWVDGDASTEFGAPSQPFSSDKRPFDADAVALAEAFLMASWRGFDAAVAAAEGKHLRKGPRGGGRDLTKMVAHVFESDRAYLRKINGKFRLEKGAGVEEEIGRIRPIILEQLKLASEEGLPQFSPRGAKLWTPWSYLRKAVWHTLDHIWEIEDRITDEI